MLAEMGPEGEEENPGDANDADELDPEDALENDESEDSEDEPEAELPEGEDEAEEEAEEPKEDEPGGEGDEEIKGLETLSKGMRKRFNGLLEQTKQAKAEIAQLQEQLKQAQIPAVLTPTAANPLADIRTEEELQERIANARAWRKWCRANPNGGQNGSEDLDADETERRLEWAETVLDGSNDRRQWLADYRASNAAARQAFPDLFKKDSPDWKAAQIILQTAPELVRHPGYESFLGHYLTGLRMALDNSRGVKWVRVDPKAKAKPGQPGADGKPSAPKAATGKPKLNAPPPAKPPLRSANGKTKPDFAALERRAASGDEQALAALLKAEMDAA